MADKISSIYEKACAKGVLDPNTKSEEWFRKQIATEDGLRSFYDYATANGMNFHPYDEFKQRIAEQPTPEQQKPAKSGYWQSIGAHNPYAYQTEQNEKEQAKQEQLRRETAATMPLSQEDKDRADKIKQLQTEGTWGKPNGTTFKIDKQTGLPVFTHTEGDGMRLSTGATNAHQTEIDRLKAEQPSYITREIRTPQDLYTSVSEAWSANTPEGQKAKAELDQHLQTTHDNLLTDLNQQIANLRQQVADGTLSADEAQRQAEQAAQNANAIYENETKLEQDYFTRRMQASNADYLAQQSRRLGQQATNQTISDLNSQVTTQIDRLEKERKQTLSQAYDRSKAAGGAYGAIGAMMSANTAYDPAKDSELSLYRQSRQFLDDATKISRAAQDQQGFFRAFGQSMSDIDTWDFGISQLTRSANLKNVVEKYEKGKQLTPAEKSLMDAAVAYMSSCAYNSDQLNRRYKAGQTTGESVPFMLQFMVMPIDAIKSKVAKAVVGYGIEQFGGKAAQAAGKTAAKYTAKTAFKEAGAALLGNLAAAGVQTATFGVPKIAEGAISRMTGDIEPVFDESGKIVYGGRSNQQGTAEAIYNATVDQYVENLSEMIMTTLDPLKAYAGTTKLFSGLKSTEIAQVLGKMNEGVIGKIRNRAQFRNYLEEVSEEYVGNLMRWGLSTDVNTADEAGFSIDQQIDTWLGLAPTSLFFAGLRAGARGVNRIQDAVAANRLRKVMEDGEERKYLESLLHSDDNSDVFAQNSHAAVKSILRNKKLEEEDKRFLLDKIYYTYQDKVAAEAEIAKAQAEAEQQQAVREQVEQQVATLTNQTDGKVYAVTRAADPSKSGHIVSGKIDIDTTTPDRPIITNDDVVTVRYADGTIEQLPARDLNLAGTPAAADEVVEQNTAEQLQAEQTKQQAAAVFHAGQAVEMTDQEGNTHTSRVVSVSDEGVEVEITDAEGKANTTIIPAATALNSLQPIAGQEQPTQEGVEQYRDQNNEAVAFYRHADGSVTLVDEDGKPVTDEQGNATTMSADEFRQFATDTQLTRTDNTQQDMQPVGEGDFGYIYDQFKGKTKEAIAFLKQQQSGEALGALHHKDIGGIDLVWGYEGTGKSDGFGLAKLLKYHPEVVDNLQEIINDMHIVSRTDNRIQLESDKYAAAVRLTWNDERKTWLLTAFQKKSSAINNTTDTADTLTGKRNDTATPQDTTNPSADKGTANNPNTQVPAPDIDKMSSDELGAATVEYMGGTTAAAAYLEAERDKAQAEVKKLIKQKVTKYTDIADFKAQNDALQAQKKAATDRLSKLEKALVVANHYQTQAEQQAAAARKAEEEAKRAARRQTEAATTVNAAPAERWQAAPKAAGNTVSRTLPDGTTIRGRYVLAEAGTATPSHDPANGWNTSNGYPVTEDGRNINDRDYQNDKDAQQLTAQMAQTYDGQAIAQVPVVSSEGIVYDGNGRTIAGNIAAANNTDAAYIQALTDNAANFGFTPEQVASMQHPRVYMQLDEDLPYNTTTLAKFNAQEKKTQSNTNRAVSQGKKLTEAARDGILAILDNYGSLDAFFASEAGANDIVKSLLSNGIITQQEVAGLTEKTDRGFVLSPAGKDYVTDLLLGSLFDEQTIRMLGNDKGLKQSILRAVPSIVENRRLGDYALTDDINGAIRLLYEARQAGQAYSLYIRQVDAFEGKVSDRFLPFEMLLAEEMSSGVETFRQVLTLYNTSARDEANGQAGLFESRTIEDIKNEILQHYAKRPTAAVEPTAGTTPASRPENPQTQSSVPSPQAGNAAAGGEGVSASEKRLDKQGNPIDKDGNLLVETVKSIDDISDEDFDEPQRNVALPAIPDNIAEALGLDGRPVVIKKNIFEKNRDTHEDLTPEDSREILSKALYNTNLYGQSKPISRPEYRVAVETGEDNNSLVVLDVYQKKDKVEIVGWRYINSKGLEILRRQIEREDGQLLILSPGSGSAAALSALPSKSSANKGTTIVPNDQTSGKKSKEKSAPTAEYSTQDAPKGEQTGSKGSKQSGENKEKKSENKIFTEDAYEAARRRMHERLNRLNAGLDPEMLSDGLIMAGYHVEKGARKFADFAKRMIEEFGDKIRPYLKSFYNGLRDLPEAAELSREMDDYATVAKFDVKAIALEPKTPENTAPAQFKVGDKVRYTTADGKTSIEATIEDVNEDGTYNIKYEPIPYMPTTAVNISADRIKSTENLQNTLPSEKKDVPLRETEKRYECNGKSIVVDKADYKTYITDEAKALFAELSQQSEKPLAVPTSAYISFASIDGAKIPAEVLLQDPNIQAAQAKIDARSGQSLSLTDEQIADYASRLLDAEHGSAVLNAKGKINKRNGEEDFSGEVAQERKALFVIGRPAGGKSSVYANPLSAQNKARIIDSDVVKPWLDGFDGGDGAGYVQEASDKVAKFALAKAVENGDNIVIPKIGGKSVIKMAADLRNAGYSVELYYNEVSEGSSIMRAAARFAETGRYLSIGYLTSIKDKAEKNFINYANKTIKEVQDELSTQQVQDLRGGTGILQGLEERVLPGLGREGRAGSGERVQGNLEQGGLRREDDLLNNYLFTKAEWKNNDVAFGEPTRLVWSSESEDPIPGTDSTRTHRQIGEVRKSTHTKTGEDIWIVKPAARVSDEEFKLLKDRAKACGGYYSSFAKNRGFIFKSEEDANQFNRINDEDITTNQTSADTETARNAGEIVSGEASSVTRDRRDSSRTERESGTESTKGGVRESKQVELTPEEADAEVDTRLHTIDKIDEATDKINDQLAVLGYYEADTSDPKQFNEQYGYLKTAEAKAVKDIDRLAKQLASDLGIEVSKRKVIAKANIAPAGGDISFRLPLENGKELYLTIALDSTEDENALELRTIMWRVEDPQASGTARYIRQNHSYIGKAAAEMRYIDLLNDIRKVAAEYLPKTNATKLEVAKKVKEQTDSKKKDKESIPNSQPVLDLFGDVADTLNEAAAQQEQAEETSQEDLHHGYKVGDIVKHKKAGEVKIVDFEIDGRPVIDSFGAKWLTEIANWEYIEPINTYNNGELRTNGRGESSTAQAGTAGQPRNENGALGGSQQPQNERPVGGRVGTSGTSHRLHDGERGGGTPLQPAEQTVTPTEPTDIEPSQWHNTRNFQARGGERLAPTTPKARYEANLAAIRLLKQLQDEDRQATPQEMGILSQYSGWGGLGEFFKGEPGTTYYSQHGENSPYQTLASIMTPEELEAAQLSRNSAYYTPENVINAMWQIAERLGFKGGNILEGSAGIGNIFALMPESISHRSNLTAVEIDDITAGILAQLYPGATTHHAGFQDVEIPNNSQDLTITNVPFVTDLHVYDKQEKDLSKRFGSIHDFCIAKNVRKLKQGGLGIFISTSNTLDKSKDLRVWLNDSRGGNADVIGAFRLNNETFGGTNATSDIIVVRKRVNGQQDPRAINVLDTSTGRIAKQQQDEVWDKKLGKYIRPEDKEVKVIYNNYFTLHPDDMGGVMEYAFEHGSTWRENTLSCYPSAGINQAERLKKWVERMKQSDHLQTYEEQPLNAQTGDYETIEGEMPYGALVVNSKGEICNAYGSRGGKKTLVPIEGINSNKVKGYPKSQVANDYNAIKQAIADLLQAQTNDISDAELKPYLRKLNSVYDDFVRKYGNLNRNTSLSFLRNDVQWASIAAIEKVKETVDVNGKKKVEVSKTDLFNKRVVGVQAVLKAENAKDGVILSMQQFGTIQPDKIAEWLGKPTEEVETEILNTRLGFRNPQTGNIEVRHQYLSGNVREKLAYAEEHNTDGSLDANIEELRKVVPVDIPAHLIEFSIGSTWIPAELYKQYAKEKYDIQDFKLNHVASSWVANEVWGAGEKDRAVGVYSKTIGKQVYGHELMVAAMNNVPVVVSKVERHYDGTTETITDKVASAACSDKISQIKDDFVEWARGKMQQDSELADRVQKIYNERFNAVVPMLKVDDVFLSKHLPGQNSAKYDLYPHQQQAVARGLTQPLMLAHEVGTGKTISLISTAMEMRRLGTAKKPMIVVQNATTQQFVSDANDLYPNAKILTVSDRDRTAEGRQEFYAKIKYNDWDLIIIPQSVFDMIPDSESRMQDFINEKIEEKMHAIEAAKEAGVNSTITQRMERELVSLQGDLETNNMSGKKTKSKDKDAKKEAEKRANAQARAKEMLDRKTDHVEDFDDMGIDALLIDEAHNYKHLGFATTMQRGVKGVDPSYSKRAAALYLKCQSVYERTGHKNVIFATGTPISNTAAEIWTFMKYLMPKSMLKENDIYYFDDFVHNFGKINEQLEFATNGKFKANNRFAQYNNVPELMRLWLSVADCTLTREVGQVNDKVPELEGGKAQDIFLEQSPSLMDIMAAVRTELEAYEKMSGKEKKENSHIPLTMYGIAKRAAIDPRLVDEDAADEPLSKTNRAVTEVLRSLNDSKKYNGTVAIFCDSYQNKQSGFNLFNDIKDKLTAQGVPANQIAIIRSEMSDTAKQKVFDAVREGDIRVIMGSTQTLGTGVNIQTRLHTLIHMDAPDRPMDYTQRNGRILRQGNMHKAWGIPVRVLRFGVEDSLDVTSYQRLKTKAGFIDSIMNGKSMIDNNLENRVLEDVDDGIFDNPVAMLSGSQYALMKSQAERDLRKWKAREQQHRIDQILIAKKTKDNDTIIAYRTKKIADDEKLIDLLEKTFPDGKVSEYNINGTVCHTAEEVKSALKELNKDIAAESDKLRADRWGDKKSLAYTLSFNGMPFHLFVNLTRKAGWKDGKPVISIEKDLSYSAAPLGEKPIASLTKVPDRLLETIESDVLTGKQARNEIAQSKESIERAQKESELMRAREGKPFAHQAELEKAQALVDEYTEKMKEEMAAKEAKYAAQSHKAVDLDKLDSEDDTTDTPAEAQYDALDYDTDHLTPAQQLATETIIDALSDAGIEVKTVSQEQAQKIFNPELAEAQIVYHGSGTKFDRFNNSYMGTGEGIQVFGWGAYVTENKEIGEYYAKSGQKHINKFIYNGEELTEKQLAAELSDKVSRFNNTVLENYIRVLSQSGETAAKEMLNSEIEHLKDRVANVGLQFDQALYDKSLAELKALANAADNIRKETTTTPTNLYTVEIPNDNGKNYFNYYDIVPQSEIERILNALPKSSQYNANILTKIEKDKNSISGEELYGLMSVYLGGDKAASQFLGNLGYIGIKYPTNTLHGGNKDGLNNFVIFSENDLQIKDRVEIMRTSDGTVYGYAQGGTIYLTPEGLNPNTPIHEYAHLWVAAIKRKAKDLYRNLQDLFSRANLPDMWAELDRDPHYAHLSDEAKLSEIISRFSGKRGAERMEAEAQQHIAAARKQGKQSLARAISLRERMRSLLRKMWDWVGENLFHIRHFGSREEAADRVLYDLLNATDLGEPTRSASQPEFSVSSPVPPKLQGETTREWAVRIAEWRRRQLDQQQVEQYKQLITHNGSKLQRAFGTAYKLFVDKFAAIDRFQQWVQAQGGTFDPDTMDMHADLSLAFGRIETFSNRYKDTYIQHIADTISAIEKKKDLRSALQALNLRWQNFEDESVNGKPLTTREIMGVYAQARDTREAEELGLADRGAQGFVNNIGMTHDQLIDAVEGALPQANIDAFWDAVYAANQFALDYQFAAGMIDTATRERYTRRYYVPQRGWRERDFDGMDTQYVKDSGTHLYGNPYNAALVRARGRQSLASDPFALIESIGLTSIRQSEHNKSKQQLLNLLLANERIGLQSGAWTVRQVWAKNVIDPATGRVMRKPDGTPIEAEISYAAPTQAEREHDNAILAEIDQLRRKPLTNPAAIVRRDAEIDDLQNQLIYTGRATNTMIEHRTRDEKRQHQVVVLKDGQQYIIELQDEALANAVNGNFGEAYNAYKLINKLNAPAIRYMSGMLTQYNPRFASRNFWRDAQAAFINNMSELGIRFATQAAANIPVVQRTIWQYILADTYKDKESYGGKYGDYLREYFEAGAQTGFSFMPELDRMAKDFDKMIKGDNAWDLICGRGVKGTLSMLTEASELTVRFAQFVTARQLGYSTQQAAKMAKDITVNFNQSGLVSKEMSKYFTFFNATVQGNMRELMPHGKNRPAYGKAALKFGAKFAGIAANFALLGLFSVWLNPDDPDDETWFTEYDRMSNFILFGMKIPVVHFFRMFYAAGVQAALAAQRRKTWKDAFCTSVDYALSELVPTSALQLHNMWDYDEATNTVEFTPAKYAQSAAPSVVSPIIDVVVNRDFKGSTVYRKKWDGQKKNITTAKRNTPQWAQDVSNTLHRWSGGNPNVPYKGGNTDGWIDIKPNAIEHLAEGYFSGVWESIGHTAGFAYDAITGGDNYKHITNYPFLRDLFRDYSEEKSYNQEYYSVVQKLENYEKRVNSFSEEEFQAEKQSDRYKTYREACSALEDLPNPYKDKEQTVNAEDINAVLRINMQLNRNLFKD